MGRWLTYRKRSKEDWGSEPSAGGMVPWEAFYIGNLARAADALEALVNIADVVFADQLTAAHKLAEQQIEARRAKGNAWSLAVERWEKELLAEYGPYPHLVKNKIARLLWKVAWAAEPDDYRDFQTMPRPALPAKLCVSGPKTEEQYQRWLAGECLPEKHEAGDEP